MSAGRRLLAVADALPVTVLAVIAGAGSFTHIRDTAAQHGQGGPMSWAVAVCIDLTCVMAARERQRDKQHGITTRRLSWPTVVLAGGVLLSLAANLAQAQPTAWGRIVAAVPPAAFLVAVSMIERRAARRPRPVAGRGRRCRRAVRAGTAVPGAGCRGRGPGRRGRGAARGARGGPPPSTRTSTGSRSPATRSAPGSASPTRPPPSCCASSAPARASRREPPAPPDPGCLPAPAGAPGPRSGQLRRGALAREYCPAARGAGGGSTGTAKAWQPTGTGSPATGRPARGQRPLARSAEAARCRRGGPPAGSPGRPGTVSGIGRPFSRDSRTCRPSMSPANLLANTGTCRQRSPLSAADVQDTARINLPVDSQTHISVKLYKTIVHGGPQMRDVR